jgi:hypothetical protein
MVGLFEAVRVTFGLRLRDPEGTLDHLATAGSGLIQWLALRNVLVLAAAGETERTMETVMSDTVRSNDVLNTPVPGPGLNGTTAEWTLAAISYLGLVDAFCEPDPGYDPRMAITSWIRPRG